MSIRREKWDSLDVLLGGSTRSPAIVLLHGFLGAPTDWSVVIEQLGSQFFCIAPQIPGTGVGEKIDCSRSGALSVEAVAAELLSVIGVRYPQLALLAGYSLGGRVALAWAAQGGRSERLALLSTNPGIDSEDEREQRRLGDAELTRLVRREGLATFVARWYQSTLFTGIAEDGPAYERLLKRRVQENSPERVALVLSELSPGVMPSYWSSLADLPPSLWLAGSKDLKYLQICDLVATRFPRVQTATIPGVSHALLFEAPAAVAEALSAFIHCV